MLRSKLLDMMTCRNMNTQQLSDASGLSIETIKNLLYGRVTDPKLNTLIPVCDALNCSLDYLMGRGRIGLQKVRDFPSHSINMLERIIDVEHNLIVKSQAENASYRMVIVPNKLTGDDFIYDSCSIGYIDVSSELIKYPTEMITCGLQLQGDKMSPIYYANDILLINGNRHPNFHEIGIFYSDAQKFYIRKYMLNNEGNGILVSLHPHRPPLTVKGSNLQCFGTVIGVHRGELYHYDCLTDPPK